MTLVNLYDLLRRMRLMVIAAALGSTAAIGQGAPYPAPLVRVIVGQPAGGAADFNARILAEALSHRLGRPVIVENRPGAAGNIGTAAVAKGKPDGSTLLLASQNIVSNYLIYQAKVHPTKELIPVGLWSSYPYILIASNASGISTVDELVTRAKAAPEKLNMGTAGRGSGAQLTARYLMQIAGINFTEIPFNGVSETLQAVLSGTVDVTFNVGAAPIGAIKAGKVRALGVTSTKAITQLPNVAPLRDRLPGFNFVAWFGVLVPSATPPQIVHILSSSINEILKDPVVRSKLETSGYEVLGGAPQEFAQTIESDLKRFGGIVDSLNVKTPTPR